MYMRDHTPTDLPPAYMTIRQTARYAGVSVACVRKWLKRGLPHSKPGCILIRVVDFDRWMDSYRVQATRDVHEIVDSVMMSLMAK
jgi:hypothetical protein